MTDLSTLPPLSPLEAIRSRVELQEVLERAWDSQQHDCSEYLVWKEADWTETHGLDCGPYEHCHEEWLECSICGDRFTQKEVNGIFGDSQEHACEC
jgi:hypothetical protein